MRMVKSVSRNVTAEFTTNKALQEKALMQAIAVLTAGPGGTMGKDIVGEAFTAEIKNYKTNYAKMPAGQDDILVTLEKGMYIRCICSCAFKCKYMYLFIYYYTYIFVHLCIRRSNLSLNLLCLVRFG
jgi:hypothetical protein